MSGGLMSCVRENSPPLDMDVNVSGPLSLPEPSINNSDLIGSIHSSSQHNLMSSTPLAAQTSPCQAESLGVGSAAAAASTPTATPPSTEQTKRRRFHPLRNLRRIFRRRTITSATTAAGDTSAPTALAATSTNSNSEKNLRSATLSSITSVASASSPSSPLTHQQLQDAYLTQSLPKSKSSYSSLLGVGKKHQNHDLHVNSETKTKSKHKHKNQKQNHQQQAKEYENFERHQQQQQQQFEAEDMFGTTTQTSASYHHQHQHHHHATSSSTMSAAGGTNATTKSSLLSQRQSMGVAVFPGAINRSFFTERQKLRSVGDSSQDLDSGSGNDSGTGGNTNNNSLATQRAKNSGSASGGEMSDSQRSLSEGRLVDSDYSREGLSQSHDSVFSESATASSLSIVLKAELADVLRKRRNRPDASDEDLGLPRSPASPQRRAANTQHNGSAAALHSTSSKTNMGEKHSEVSSLSLLSMNSNDGEDFLANSSTSTTNNSSAATDMVQERATATRYSRSSTTTSISISSDILRHRDSSFDETKDEIDLFSSDWQRLSHNAAKHKMAIRPTKKKGGPSRQHRRTLETSIPEANEDLNKFMNRPILEVTDLDIKVKTLSLPLVVNNAKVMDETPPSPHTATTKESTTRTTKINNSNTNMIQSTNTLLTYSTTTATTEAGAATATPSNMFGLRNLTAKATSMFDTKDLSPNEEVANKVDNTKKTEPAEKSLETTETGFLRRLMHRNSKRSIAKANVGEQDQDELDRKQNEPKKLQISATASTSNNSNMLDKAKNDLTTYENTVEEKRREIKKEIYQESKIMGQTLIANSFAMPSAKEDRSPAKPKSGPAARQRYLPQNISNEDLIKINEEPVQVVCKERALSKSLTNETFQSTSLVREITKQQNNMMTSSPHKIEHHFEKKPKIVGLSAFQQKVSRSNDAFARGGSSANISSVLSLDKLDADLNSSSSMRLQTYEQKQRKSVEKSRSFRAYGEQKNTKSSSVMHNNMPSLPDLSLSLRVPYYKEFPLNDKQEYAEELIDEKHISLDCEINNQKLLKPERESRKSFNNYDKNFIMSSGTANKTIPTKQQPTAAAAAAGILSNRNVSDIENNFEVIVKSPFVSVVRKSINLTEDQVDEMIKEKLRPPMQLSLRKEKSLSEENILNTPSTAAVTLRDKSVSKTNNLFTSSLDASAKDIERKSAPANNHKSSNGFRCNSTRRASSVVDSCEKSTRCTVPEFMKIQLNRVDPARTSKSHVVLAKNVKEISKPLSRECSPEKNFTSSSMDDLSIRRLSSESVDINERTSPETEKRFSGLFHEAINKQAKVCTGLPPKSPLKKTPTTPTTPPTPIINEREREREHFKLTETLENYNNNMTVSASALQASSLSLHERRRLFMQEEKLKMEKKLEEIKFERKKSLSEEVSKKSPSRSENNEQKEKDFSPVDNVVVLRKKSFASSVHSLNGNSVNNSISSSSSCSSSSNSNNGNSHKDDATPELMKVFARRSLKIKDEDLDKMLNSNLSAPQTLKKFTNPSSNPSVDSDKENQSASDEKLDKLPKMETNQTVKSPTALNGSSMSVSNNNNRNSLADFRLGGTKISHPGLTINNNNNNGSTTNGDTTALANNKNFLPPIKLVSGLRGMSIERNNNHNTALSPTKTTASTLDRSTIKLGDLSSCSSTDGPLNVNKTIERSATMGEFKGIHQRRAEWEQRAKEALK